MFNRSSTYKYFRVNQSTTIEDMDGYEKTGPYVSDKSFTQEILKQFDSTDQPQLIFTISMQNHFPFENHRFTKNPIQISNSLNQDDHDSLETYINGTYYSDQAYLQLRQVIEQSNKPTVIFCTAITYPYSTMILVFTKKPGLYLSFNQIGLKLTIKISTSHRFLFGLISPPTANYHQILLVQIFYP